MGNLKRLADSRPEIRRNTMRRAGQVAMPLLQLMSHAMPSPQQTMRWTGAGQPTSVPLRNSCLLIHILVAKTHCPCYDVIDSVHQHNQHFMPNLPFIRSCVHT